MKQVKQQWIQNPPNGDGIRDLEFPIAPGTLHLSQLLIQTLAASAQDGGQTIRGGRCAAMLDKTPACPMAAGLLPQKHSSLLVTQCLVLNDC